MEATCLIEQKRLTDQYLQLTGKVRSCMPLEEWNNRIRDKVERLLPLDQDLTISEGGIIIPREIHG